MQISLKSLSSQSLGFLLLPSSFPLVPNFLDPFPPGATKQHVSLTAPTSHVSSIMSHCRNDSVSLRRFVKSFPPMESLQNARDSVGRMDRLSDSELEVLHIRNQVLTFEQHPTKPHSYRLAMHEKRYDPDRLPAYNLVSC